MFLFVVPTISVKMWYGKVLGNAFDAVLRFDRINGLLHPGKLAVIQTPRWTLKAHLIFQDKPVA